MSEMTPRQQMILERVFAAGAPRPEYPSGFEADLRSRIEEALEADVAAMEEQQLRVGKSPLSRVHVCEGYYLAQRTTFELAIPLMTGKVAHRMVQVMLGTGDATPSLELADNIVRTMISADGQYSGDEARFLENLDPVQLADVKTAATNHAVQFSSDWPPEVRRWKPRVESQLRVDLLGGRLRLQGNPDILFAAPRGDEARVVIVDLKTGSRHPSHLDDLRYYALLQTLRDGVPPYRVASYYLQEGEVHPEDVSAETLDTAARRTIDGVRKMIELETREAKLNAGWHCTWCSARRECETGLVFLKEKDRAEPD